MHSIEHKMLLQRAEKVWCERLNQQKLEAREQKHSVPRN